MNFENILLDQRNAILTITINRENKLNALNQATLSELHVALLDAQKKEAIRVIIITGKGSKSFVAGADISELRSLTPQNSGDFARSAQINVFNLIENSTKPIIAVINGYALGGGLELALACHIRIAGENAKLGLPELKLGLIPCYGGTQRLASLIGKGKALEVILTSDMLSAQEALQVGLVNHVTPLSEVIKKAEEIAHKILKNPPHAAACAIRAVNAYDTSDGFETEINAFTSCVETDEFTEGVAAFLEKRDPKFN